MFILGIIFGITVAFMRAVDVFLCKKLISDKSAALHSFCCIIFCVPFLFIMSLFNWKLDFSAMVFIILYGLIETINIFFHQRAIKHLEPVSVEILSKSKTFIVYIISLFMLIESFSISGFLGIILFMVGIFLTIDFSLLNKNNFSSFKGYIFEIISVLARTIKPFILKYLITSNKVSNEVLVLFAMIISAALIFIIFKPKIQLEKNDIKGYLLRAFFDSIGMILSGYSILFSGALMASMTENLSIFIVAIFSYIIYKKKIDAKIIIGMFFVIGGLILI